MIVDDDDDDGRAYLAHAGCFAGDTDGSCLGLHLGGDLGGVVISESVCKNGEEEGLENTRRTEREEGGWRGVDEIERATRREDFVGFSCVVGAEMIRIARG